MAVAVLRALAKARFASFSSLLAYGGPLGLRADVITAWIAAGLLHQGKVLVDPLTGTEQDYLALSERGAHELTAATGSPAQGMPRSRLRRSSQKRSHDLAVGDLVLAVISLAREGTIELLGIETDESRFASRVTLSGPGMRAKHVPLVADALLAVRSTHGPSGLLVEVDRGTISLERMAEKYRAYLAWKRSGRPEAEFSIKAMRVLTLAPDRRRLDRLMAAALEVNDDRPSGFLIFALQDDVRPHEPERLRGPVVRRLGDGEVGVPLFS